MRKKSFMLRTLAAGLAVFSSVAAMGQSEPDWLQDVSDRIQLHGYAQGGFNYTHTDDADVNSFELKRTLFWANAQITDRVSFNDLDEEADIVDAVKPLAELLICDMEMAEIGFRIVLAGIAIALWIKRGEILFVFVAADIDSAFAGHESAMSSNTGWENAIEHIDTEFDATKDVVD